MPVPEGPVAGPEPTAADRALWLAWSGCGVVLLLSVTNHLTQNVAPVPFLWILPLGLYLLSFILCFNLEQAYIRSIYLGPVAIVLVGMSFAILRYNSTTPLGLVLGVFSACLFGGCMFCHGELSRRKPCPRHLTGYYLMHRARRRARRGARGGGGAAALPRHPRAAAGGRGLRRAAGLRPPPRGSREPGARGRDRPGRRRR